MLATQALSRSRASTNLRSTFRQSSASTSTLPKRPSIAPKPCIDIKHIRDNPDLYTQTCLDRNYLSLKDNPQRIVQLFKDWKEIQDSALKARQRNNDVLNKLKSFGAQNSTTLQERDELLLEAKSLKGILSKFSDNEIDLASGIQNLAAQLPNLTCKETPIGKEPRLLGYINHPPTAASVANHVSIGNDLDLIDFGGASTASGWGWYFLKNECALLEHALVQYALHVAMRHGFSVISPPSMVYSHIASACGFQPRDQGGEQQSYTIARTENNGKPEMTLAGTAEIPLAGMKANTTMNTCDLPLQVVGASRCYRAEAGARGLETKGLYRVHEFTKVEMFAWTTRLESDAAFNSMLTVQKEILRTLSLHCRILEMPSTDLGASASRKIDIEAFFPSRKLKDDGFGEVTSVSICTDYQTRRLNTRLKLTSKTDFPFTVNGTALAVPRVLAAILENGWNEQGKYVEVPEVLHPWMHGIKTIKQGS
ncbi:MAG: hypothetical protein Q9182_004324 [Xanthomendoza sp. 2 TL-2023]